MFSIVLLKYSQEISIARKLAVYYAWSSDEVHYANMHSTKTTDLSSKLGKDGKLLPEEHQQCIDQGLCLLCGLKGHMVKECPKFKLTNSSKPKGHTAKTSSDTKAQDSMATESKKKSATLEPCSPRIAVT